MRIVSYNVNGIRSAIKKGFLEWLAEEKPDVLCLQEIRADESVIEKDLFEALGYHCYWCSAERKGYSGVGILSLQKPEKVMSGMGVSSFDQEGRLLSITLGELTVSSAYFPNGYGKEERRQFKKTWMEYFADYASNLLHTSPFLVISGDFNMCGDVLDIHDAALTEKNEKLFLEEDRTWMQEFLEVGFVDSFRYLCPKSKEFSWWSMRTRAKERNHGWRMDYNMVSTSLQANIKNAWLQPDITYSDHCPAWLELDV